MLTRESGDCAERIRTEVASAMGIPVRASWCESDEPDAPRPGFWALSFRRNGYEYGVGIDEGVPAERYARALWMSVLSDQEKP